MNMEKGAIARSKNKLNKALRRLSAFCKQHDVPMSKACTMKDGKAHYNAFLASRKAYVGQLERTLTLLTAEDRNRNAKLLSDTTRRVKELEEKLKASNKELKRAKTALNSAYVNLRHADFTDVDDIIDTMINRRMFPGHLAEDAKEMSITLKRDIASIYKARDIVCPTGDPVFTISAEAVNDCFRQERLNPFTGFGERQFVNGPDPYEVWKRDPVDCERSLQTRIQVLYIYDCIWNTVADNALVPMFGAYGFKTQLENGLKLSSLGLDSSVFESPSFFRLSWPTKLVYDRRGSLTDYSKISVDGWAVVGDTLDMSSREGIVAAAANLSSGNYSFCKFTYGLFNKLYAEALEKSLLINGSLGSSLTGLQSSSFQFVNLGHGPALYTSRERWYEILNNSATRTVERYARTYPQLRHKDIVDAIHFESAVLQNVYASADGELLGEDFTRLELGYNPVLNAGLYHTTLEHSSTLPLQLKAVFGIIALTIMVRQMCNWFGRRIAAAPSTTTLPVLPKEVMSRSVQTDSCKSVPPENI